MKRRCAWDLGISALVRIISYHVGLSNNGASDGATRLPSSIKLRVALRTVSDGGGLSPALSGPHWLTKLWGDSTPNTANGGDGHGSLMITAKSSLYSISK
jgi:hypothetical protein